MNFIALYQRIADWLWAPIRRPKTKYDLANILECEECLKFMDLKTWLRLMNHLIDEHGCDVDQASDALREAGHRMRWYLEKRNSETRSIKSED